MKTIKYRLIRTMAVTAMLLAFVLPTSAQKVLDNTYYNIDWQFNFPLSNHFADKASGWGMNAEGGYYATDNFGVGAFIAYSTNNEYIPRQMIHMEDGSIRTTDQQHSVFQLPFGATARYRFMPGGTVEPYIAAKLGANYSEMSSYYNVFKSNDKNWGFYASPEVGLNIFPSSIYRVGFHVAAYYSYATNKGKVMTYNIDGLNNFGLRLGVTF